MAMAGTSLEKTSNSLPSPSTSHSFLSQSKSGRHFYLAVDRLQFKMETLVDLLGVAGRQSSLPMVICCSSRDELDSLCSTVSNLSFISFSPLYSEQDELEREKLLEKFRMATIEWNQSRNYSTENNTESENLHRKACLIVSTDSCLPSQVLGEAPLMARLLINYELPTKKEAYFRRISSCLATDGIVINMVVGGEVTVLKGLEESSGIIITEMPISISEIL